MAVKKSSFGTYPDGREVTLYTLTNEKGMEVSVTDLGAIIVRIIVPDAQGKKELWSNWRNSGMRSATAAEGGSIWIKVVCSQKGEECGCKPLLLF